MTYRMDDLRDADGFADIGSYAVLGDGQSVALVAPDGRVDWWPIPVFDSPPTFAALLDPERGGRIELCPVDETATVERRYLPETNILETTFTTAEGASVRVTDCLNSGNAGALPWSELARRVEGVHGSVRMRFAVSPGTGLGLWEPWAARDDRGVILHAGQVVIGLRCSAGIRVQTGDADAHGRFTIDEGQRLVVALVASYDEPLYLAHVEDIDARIDYTAENWRHWASQVRWDGDRREQVVRSALALKTLLIADSGAIAAAATTSLPEEIGGPKNWDYRFSWVRDAALTIGALSDCGLHEEVHGAMSWLLNTIRANGPEIHVMYTLQGDVPANSRNAPVPGYRGSQPVRLGNDAVGQLQLGIYGDLFQTVSRWVFGGHVLDVDTSRLLTDLADRCADTWLRDDAGIWELQDDRPYTSSKMNCWRALDRAAVLAERGHIGGFPDRWRATANRIKSWVDENCWSDRKQAYTFYAGSDDLDASVLLGASFGFDRGKRMSSTIDALRAELSAGSLIYRYSGVHREEQTFIACAYWVVEALALVGRLDEAQTLMTELDPVANDVGLLSEMSSPGSVGLVGNTPQALSHLALINAAGALQGNAGDDRI